MTKGSLEKAKRTAVHSTTGKIQYTHFFDLTFKERLVKQTEEENPHGELPLPVSVNTDSSEAMEINDTNVTFNHISP